MENVNIPAAKASSLKASVSVCPCCGHKFEGSLMNGCPACGAQAVGDPLARPETELPSFGRSFFMGAIGSLLLLLFLVFTFIAHLKRPSFDFDFWSIASSAEAAAWRLKWIAIPFSILSIWAGMKICASIRQTPKRFMWSELAHSGLAASVLFALMVATFIGITAPERLRQRQRSLEAAQRAKLYTVDRILLEYRLKYGTLPATPADLKKVNDDDGDVALAIEYLQNGNYQPSSKIAGKIDPLSKKRPIRNASLTSDDAPTETVIFDEYEVRLAGEDGLFGNEDDWIIKDGVVTKAEGPLAPSQIPSTLKRVKKKSS
jgi:hypothetical protein